MPIAALLLPLALLVATDDWPQWRGPRRDGTWNETGIVEKLPEGQLPLRWRAAIGPGYSGPTVAGELVYVTDRMVEPEERERVLAFDWKSGERAWLHEYPASYAGISYSAGPRVSVLVHEGLAYSLGAAGRLCCLDASTGELRWEHDLKAEYEAQIPVWGLAASPIVEGRLLIVPACGGEGAYLVAFDRKSGEEVWTALSDHGNYSSPIVIDQAKRRVLVCWTAERIVGVAPEDGALLWEKPFQPLRTPLGVASPVLYEDRLFFTGFYDGSLVLRLAADKPAVEEVWRRRGQNERHTDGLQSIISTPLVRGEHVYGVDSYGELRCLKLEDGARVWEDLSAVPKERWATIHFVQNGERTWMLNERGELLVGELSPEGFHELSRAKLIEPTREQLNEREGVVWSHPAFANRHVFARNDEALVCADLSAE